MAKFYGIVGFESQVQISPGYFDSHFVDRPYKGDVLQSIERWSPGDQPHDDLTLSNRISIVADGFAYQNSHLMRYVELDGVRWKVVSVQIARPRVILTLGGAFNG